MSSRIVSLLPSATEIVCALGLGPSLVGRSHECDYPPEVASLPVCTRAGVNASGTSAEIHAAVSSILEHRVSIYDVDEALLRELRPTHIVTQVQCEVCAVSLHDVHRTLSNWGDAAPEVISLRALTLAGMFSDIGQAADSLGAREQARRLVASLQRRINEISAAVPRDRRRRVVAMEWLDPPMGTGNWMPELIELAGGIDLLSAPGQHSRWTTWEAVQAADPEILILFPCGFSVEKTRSELTASRLPPFRGEIILADGNHYFNRPGPRLVETLEILAEILHPDCFNFGHRGKSWVDLSPSGRGRRAKRGG